MNTSPNLTLIRDIARTKVRVFCALAKNLSMKNLSQYVSVSGTLYLRSLVLRNFITAGKGSYDAVPLVFKQSLILVLRHSRRLICYVTLLSRLVHLINHGRLGECYVWIDIREKMAKFWNFWTKSNKSKNIWFILAQRGAVTHAWFVT